MQKIQFPISMFMKGSVVYIEFPYEEQPEKSKRRPAVVIDYDTEHTRVVLLKVTTKGVRTRYDYPLAEPEMAGLAKESVVRCNHTLALPNTFKCEKYGSLSRHDALAIEYLYNTAVTEQAITKVPNK